jgi:hypothetical protein
MISPWSIPTKHSKKVGSSMKVTAFKGSVEKAYGKDLPAKVDFSGSYEHLEKHDVIPADEVLTAEDILDVVNNKRKASARAAETLKALNAAGITKPDMNDPAIVRENAIKTHMKLFKCSRERAEMIQKIAEESNESLAATVA